MDGTGARPRSRLAVWRTRCLAVATAGYTVILVFATHYPRPQELVGANPPSDKVLHVAAYTVLGVLVTATLGSAGFGSPRMFLGTATALAAFGVVDEVTQPLPWFRRHADPVDWVFDCIGVAAGVVVVAAIVARSRHRARQ